MGFGWVVWGIGIPGLRNPGIRFTPSGLRLLRTMNPDMPPSELIVANALRITLPVFLAVPAFAPDLTKIIDKYRPHDPPSDAQPMAA